MGTRIEKILHISNRDQAGDAIGSALVRRLRQVETLCPLPEEIALLVDEVLPEVERQQLFEHLAACGKCRQTFVKCRQMISDEEDGASRRSWHASLHIAAAAICIAIIAIISRGWNESGRQTATVNTEVASSRSPGMTITGGSGTSAGDRASTPSETIRHLVANPTRPLIKGSEPLELLTAEEAAAPESRIYGFSAMERADGPIIAVESPKDEEITFFTPLRIKFTPRDGDEIDLKTFKVECLKDSPIDVTARLKPHVDINGINVQRATAPAGRYRFRVSVADINGRFSEREFTVNVTGKF